MKSRRFLIAALLASCVVGQPGCGESGDPDGGATAVPSAGAAPAGGSAPAGGPAPAPPKTSGKAKEAPTEVYD